MGKSKTLLWYVATTSTVKRKRPFRFYDFWFPMPASLINWALLISQNIFQRRTWYISHLLTCLHNFVHVYQWLLNFLCFNKFSCVYFQVTNIPPISIDNELSVLHLLRCTIDNICTEKFSTDLQNDEDMFSNPVLSINARNCYDIRIREKMVLRHLLDLCSSSEVLLKMTWRDLESMTSNLPRSGHLGRFDGYLLNVVVPLVRHAE